MPDIRPESDIWHLPYDALTVTFFAAGRRTVVFFAGAFLTVTVVLAAGAFLATVFRVVFLAAGLRAAGFLAGMVSNFTPSVEASTLTVGSFSGRKE
ncbi:MAG: hypothetical protein M3488_02285, partial [Actinomycetota bacterium]|nr:hypothetical protein [Actinomycetota bacterium]